MKPRTKKEFEVMKAFNLRQSWVQPEIEKYALKCNERLAINSGKKFWCNVCGEEGNSKEIKNGHVKCVHCGSDLKEVVSRKRKTDEWYWIAFAELLGDYELIRYFYISIDSRKGARWRVKVFESVCHFFQDRKMFIVGRKSSMSQGLPIHGDMELRKPTYYSSFSYDIIPYAYHPLSHFRSDLEFRGCKGNIGNVNYKKLRDWLPYSSYAETLLKAGQTSLLNVLLESEYSVTKHWSSIKICLRNNYKVKEARIYLDYLDLLKHFGKDLKNAHYVCPDDLKQAHDYWMFKKQKEIAKLKEEQRKKKAIKDQKLFEELKSQFFGLVISENNIEVKVLESIDEYIQEAEVMKHCVFTNEYYLKPESLCLTASVNGEKMETVEVSIKNGEILQCHGKLNQPSPYHQDIIDIVNKHRPAILTYPDKQQLIA